MDDDDEFGDLYTDVLQSFSSSSAAASHPPLFATPAFSANPSNDLNLQIDDEDIIHRAPDPNLSISSHTTHQTLVPEPGKTEEQRLIGVGSGTASNWIDEDRVSDDKSEEKLDRVLENLDSSRVLESKIAELPIKETRVLEALEPIEKSSMGKVNVEDGDKSGVLKEKDGIFPEIDLDSEPVIPGLSSAPLIPGVSDSGGNDGDDVGGGGDDWESDSDDDLQIVLNEKSGLVGDEDEDGEDFVIVADGGQHNQAMEEQEWGEDSAQVADGERKEVGGEAVRVNGGVGNAVGVRVGFINHAYHPHHSQFKYVRPGASVIPGGAVVGSGGVLGQVRPPINMGLIAGRGRGDWRPVGFKNAPTMQKNFHTGFGPPVWANNSSGRGFGNGSDFTIPSHKTIFDVDIDSFEEKPWRNPGVDTSDFFNFGLEENTWKDYCKQLEYLRLEATMQSKIRVHETGRSEQDYDPDFPPELAAAAGIHDASVENAHHGKIDDGQGDATGQGRGSTCIRPPMPTGRAIQVESSYVERLPSIDTRPLRVRDSDAIIEIVLQDSGDDDPITANCALQQPNNDPMVEDLKGGDVEEDMVQGSIVGSGRDPLVGSGRDPFMGSLHDNVHEGDGILPFPQEAPLQYHSGSRGRTPIYPGGLYHPPHNGRWPQGTTRDRNPHLTAEHGNDVIPRRSAQINRVHDNQREKLGKSIDGRQTPESSSAVSDEAARETSVEHKVGVDNELAMTNSSVALEGEEKTKDNISPSGNLRDGSPLHSVEKEKLSSQVEQPVDQDIGSGDDVRATRSRDNSKARSGSSRDYQKQRDGGEEEVVQEGRSRHLRDMKRPRDEDGRSFREKDDYGRDVKLEMARNHMVVKGREDSLHSYPHKYWDSNSTHSSRIKMRDFERPRERDNSVGSWQRRDEDVHGRRLKDEEMGSRHESKVRESERFEKDEHRHSKKRLDNGDWRGGHHDKDVGPRWRERDDNLTSWHENFDDPRTKTRKDGEHQRREQADKEVLHGYRGREDTGRRKRERDDGSDQPRIRDKLDDYHSRHLDESWRHRERDYRRSLRQPHEDTISNPEREGRGVLLSGRGTEDKSWVGSAGAKDDSKGLGSDKDYQFKDKRRQSEQPMRNGRVEDDKLSQHRGREDVYAREHQFNNEDRDPRHERSRIYNDHLPVNASDGQWMHKERHKENTRRKESGVGDENSLGSRKTKQADHISHRSEKVSMKATSDQENGYVPTSGPTKYRDPGQSRLSSSALSKKSHHEHEVPQQRDPSRKRKEDAMSDDEQRNSRKGRSKLERWVSHKDRDGNAITHSTSSKAKESVSNNNDPSSLACEQPDENRNASELEIKDASTEPIRGSGHHVESDKVGDDRHLDTVAKLKKRSERFKIPMPSEKDSVSNRKTDNESLIPTQSEAIVDAEIKPERPARKRRWISS